MPPASNNRGAMMDGRPRPNDLLGPAAHQIAAIAVHPRNPRDRRGSVPYDRPLPNVVARLALTPVREGIAPRVPAQTDVWKNVRSELLGTTVLASSLPSSYRCFRGMSDYAVEGWFNLLFGGLLAGFFTGAIWRETTGVDLRRGGLVVDERRPVSVFADGIGGANRGHVHDVSDPILARHELDGMSHSFQDRTGHLGVAEALRSKRCWPRRGWAKSARWPGRRVSLNGYSSCTEGLRAVSLCIGPSIIKVGSSVRAITTASSMRSERCVRGAKVRKRASQHEEQPQTFARHLCGLDRNFRQCPTVGVHVHGGVCQEDGSTFDVHHVATDDAVGVVGFADEFQGGSTHRRSSD